MDKYLTAHRILNEMKDQGLTRYVPATEQRPDGYAPIDDRIATVFGPPSVPIKEGYDLQLTDRLNTLADSLGISHERKVAIGGQRMGYAEKGTGNITTKFATPESVLAHEIGHQLEWKYGLSDLLKARDYPERTQELRALADLRYEGQDASAAFKRYVRNKDEKMANAVAALVYAPEKFQAVAPNTWDFLRDELWHIPELRPFFEANRSMVLASRTAQLPVSGIRIMGQYYAPEPAARVINNYLSPGLRERSGLFRAYLGAGNFLNQAQLGISAFHLGFTGIDSAVSKLGLGFYQIAHGQPLEGFKSIVATPAAPLTNFLQGSKVLREWFRPGSEGGDIAQIVDAMKMAGGRAQMDQFYQTNIRQRMMDAFRQGNPIGGALRLPGAAVEKLASYILQDVVPRQKMGIFSDMARTELARLGPNADRNAVRTAMQKAWDSVDNRMGQMVYDNLFWNKTAKDLAMASVRSVGWNLGTIRELGGGMSDILHGDASLRASYVAALPILTGLIGATTQYLMTGQPPQSLRDYYFPQTGNLDENGRPERVALPSYMKDVYAYTQQPGRTLLNKIHPMVNGIAEMLQNRDYYGTEIRNPDDPLVRQALDTLKFIGTSAEPFAIRNIQKEQERGATLAKTALPLVGVVPAPADINKTPAEQLASRYAQQLTPAVTRTQEQAAREQLRSQIERKMRMKQDATAEIQQGLTSGQLNRADLMQIHRDALQPPLHAQIGKLPLQQALSVYQAANDQEKQSLRPLLFRKMKSAMSRPGEITPAARQMAQQLFGTQFPQPQVPSGKPISSNIQPQGTPSMPAPTMAALAAPLDPGDSPNWMHLRKGKMVPPKPPASIGIAATPTA
jgi:hypothetical protein